ncbi:hypothetical protein DFQ26_005706 [Actinomortierella ambigua]|nr:hypothetical protein DFQ26_005706 [Actinomortierella ambigua]
MAATARARREGLWPGAPTQGQGQGSYHHLEVDDGGGSGEYDAVENEREMVYMAPSIPSPSSSSTIRSTTSFSSTTAPLTVPSILGLKRMGDEENKRLLQSMYGSSNVDGGDDGGGGGVDGEFPELGDTRYGTNYLRHHHQHHHLDHDLAEADASDTEEKFMDLPDPSPFEGMCSCRGLVNIVAIAFILMGLILLILGYPIAKFANREPDPIAWIESDAAGGKSPPLLNKHSRAPVAKVSSNPASIIAALSSAVPPSSSSPSSSSGKNDEGEPLEPAEVISETLLQAVVGMGKTGSSLHPRMARSRALVIDPDTPLDKRTRVALDGSSWHLAFSDEFNRDGRSFEPGQDPHWEAVELPTNDQSSSSPLENYARNAVTTKGGHLEIQLSREEVSHSRRRKRQHAERALPQYKYTSGMLQSWNKLCFQGGILEARYGYKATMDGMWPYSYSVCEAETMRRLNNSESKAAAAAAPSPPSGAALEPPQRLSACLRRRSKDSPSPGVGRGAPQIDLLEVYHGKLIEPTMIVAQTPQTRTFKRDRKKRQDPSLHGQPQQQQQQQQYPVSGGSSTAAPETFDLHGRFPTLDGLKHETLEATDGAGARHAFAVSSLTVASPSSSPMSPNLGSSSMKDTSPGGANVTTIRQLSMPQDGRSSSSQAYISSASVSPEQQPSDFVSVGVEYWPTFTPRNPTEKNKEEEDAYLRFMFEQSWHHPIVESTFNTSANRPSSPVAATTNSKAFMYMHSAKVLGEGLLIPQEPMSIVLGLGLLQLQQLQQQQTPSSSPLGMTMADELQAMLSNPALTWPVVMKVDYVRLYQPSHVLVPATGTEGLGPFSASMALSCDPFDHPTAKYIRDHPVAYTDASKLTWSEAGYQSPAL